MNFSKVSRAQFKSDLLATTQDSKLVEDSGDHFYDLIELPKRATKASAGYDFFSPVGFMLPAGECITVPTGIHINLDEDKVLEVYPRSGQGFKYKIQLMNTVGIIDADYFNAKNEGHILIKIFNDNRENKALRVEEGQAFAQGIIKQYFTVDDDDSTEERVGGFGSTDK